MCVCVCASLASTNAHTHTLSLSLSLELTLAFAFCPPPIVCICDFPQTPVCPACSSLVPSLFLQQHAPTITCVRAGHEACNTLFKHVRKSTFSFSFVLFLFCVCFGTQHSTTAQTTRRCCCADAFGRCKSLLAISCVAPPPHGHALPSPLLTTTPLSSNRHHHHCCLWPTDAEESGQGPLPDCTPQGTKAAASSNSRACCKEARVHTGHKSC